MRLLSGHEFKYLCQKCTIVSRSNDKGKSCITVNQILDFRLCGPHPLNRLSNTNIIRLEFIQSNGNSQGSSAETPFEQCEGLGDSVFG
jgi:hypothetical protein